MEFMSFGRANDGDKFSTRYHWKLDRKGYNFDSRNKKNDEIKHKIHCSKVERLKQTKTALHTSSCRTILSGFLWMKSLQNGSKDAQDTEEQYSTKDKGKTDTLKRIFGQKIRHKMNENKRVGGSDFMVEMMRKPT